MSDYSQPEFYRFNEDSLKLVKYVESQVQHADCILDLGAGSGIIGIELAKRLSASRLCLLELQNDYLVHLEKNIANQLLKIQANVIIKSFGEWIPDTKYDLIVSNPPYFLPGHGQPSKDVRKNKARSFVEDSWEIFLNLIDLALTSKGKAFLVLRDDQRVLEKIRFSTFEIKTYSEGALIFVELFRLNKN